MSSVLSYSPANLLRALAVILTSTTIFFGTQVIAVFALVLALQISGVGADRIEDLFTDSLLLRMILSLLIAVVGIGLVWRVLKWRKLSPVKFLKLDKLPNIRQLFEVVGAWVVFFMVMIVVTVLLDSATAVDVEQTQELGIADPNNFLSGLMVFVMLVVVPPIYEEILFRGLLFRGLSRYLPQAGAVVLTCLLFGAVHLEYDNLNWIAAIDTLVFSGFLIYIMQRHNSLYSAMALHALKNGLAYAALFVF